MKEREVAKELHDHRGDSEEWEETPVRVKVQPARSEVVSFRLPSEQLDVIEGLADQAGQSISEFVRRRSSPTSAARRWNPSSMFNPAPPANYGSPCEQRSAAPAIHPTI
jgi:hypothetical protein